MRNFILLANLCSLFGLTSCASPTKNVSDNTMYFGTNTTIGVYVDKNLSGKTPKVVFGYTRDEKVILPLVATGADSSSCAQKEGAKPSPTCFFVGQRENGIVDSYSVLASFGGRTGSTTDEKGNKVEGAIAQYFSTGVASQLLAARGGAAVIAIGEAAKNSSNDENADTITKAVAGGDFGDLNKLSNTDKNRIKIKISRIEVMATKVSACYNTPSKKEAFEKSINSEVAYKFISSDLIEFASKNNSSGVADIIEQFDDKGRDRLQEIIDNNC